jgi:hypothetical protein
VHIFAARQNHLETTESVSGQTRHNSHWLLRHA